MEIRAPSSPLISILLSSRLFCSGGSDDDGDRCLTAIPTTRVLSFGRLPVTMVQ